VRMTDTLEKVEVITSRQRRRRWSAAEKMRMVEESLEPGASVSLVARRHGVNPNQLFTWRRLAAHGAFTAAAAGEEVVPASDYRALQEQIRDLHRLLGKKTLEARTQGAIAFTNGLDTPAEILAYDNAVNSYVPATQTFGNPGVAAAQAFVRTFKRDYVRVGACPDAKTVLRSLPAWFTHYNEIHPHRALGYRSPRQFIRAIMKT